MTTDELVNEFFSDLKKYNPTNFKTLWKADLSKNTDDPVILKSFSSVLTRYLIFKEKHPEIPREEHNLIYYKLKLDLIGKFFEHYPNASTDNFIAFQIELKSYLAEHRNVMVDIATPEKEAV